MMKLTCKNCGYHEPILDITGCEVAVQCKAEKHRVVPIDFANTMHCGYWTEMDE